VVPVNSRHRPHLGVVNPLPVLLFLLAVVAIGVGGCKAHKTATNRQLTLSNETEGYAYVAVLAAEHPLYGELRRIDRLLDALSSGSLFGSAAVSVDLGSPFKAPERLIIAGVVPRDYPAAELEKEKLLWQTSTRQELPTGLGALAPDLQARLAWERRRIQDQASERLRVAQADETQRLAAIRRQAVRSHQERLNNLGLDLTLSDTEASQLVQQESRRIWDEIEREVAAEQQKGQATLQRFRTVVLTEERKRIVEAERKMLRTMARRAQVPYTSTESLRKQMNDELLAIGKPPWVTKYSARVDTEAQDQILASANYDRVQVVKELQARRRERIARLLACRAGLMRLIQKGTQSAARAVAAQRGIIVHFPPLEPATGRDVTALLQEALHDLWHSQPPSRMGERTQ